MLFYLLFAFSSSEFASVGRCTESNLTSSANLELAPDYCPSDLSWIVVVALCMYLVKELR